jgi:Ca-activated chloride channel family protein
MRAWLFALISLSIASPIMAQRDTIRARVDLVVVPASVRDADGKFVYDLQREDFSIFEDGKPQEIGQFSIDPLPLSATVLIDTGVGGKALRRFASSIVSLGGAFTEIDEVEVFRFDDTVHKISDFTNSPEALSSSLASIQKLAAGKGEGGREDYPVFMPGRGPRWLRFLMDRGSPKRVLNEALFAAAVDLEKRKPETRKIVIVISDGQVAHTAFSLKQVRDRLTQSQIQTFGVTIGLALIEGPASILHAYARATGGDVYSGLTQHAMETAFARITEEARHEYVLAYVSNNEVPGPLPVMRTIEVKANRPNLSINHRKSYLQYPPRQ